MPTITTYMALETWPAASDFFNHTKLADNFAKLDAHDHTSTKGVQIPTGGLVNLAVATAKLDNQAVTQAKLGDGAVGSAQIDSPLATTLGVSSGAVVRRGKTVIPVSETVTSTTYALAATPDRVNSVVLPTDGLIFVLYQALWQENVNGAAVAAIFVGANQLRILSTGAAPSVAQTSRAPEEPVTAWSPLCSSGLGLHTLGNGVATGSDVTTGQTLGLGLSSGPAIIEAAAGTYDVSVQFKVSAGNNVAVKERKLWVWTQGF